MGPIPLREGRMTPKLHSLGDGLLPASHESQALPLTVAPSSRS